MDIINCGRVAYGEKFKYRYYKSYVDIECNNKLIYVDNTNYNPSEMDIENFGMYEGYTHFANILIANFRRDESVLKHIIEILNSCDEVEGGASLTQNDDISIKIFGYSSDKLIQVSDKISNYLIDLDL